MAWSRGGKGRGRGEGHLGSRGEKGLMGETDGAGSTLERVEHDSIGQ